MKTPETAQMLDVYRSYYGLTGEPFRMWPDHSFSLHHESYAKARAYLRYGIYQGEGFIALTGMAGTGKTTLINEVLADLDSDKVYVATLAATQFDSHDLLHMVANSFGLQPDDTRKSNLLIKIESFLVRNTCEGKRSILIVDEAQGMSLEALGALRLLANLIYQNKLLLQIFLVGQEPLLDLIHAPVMEPLRQRLAVTVQLEPLSFEGTVDYIEYRLRKVGWRNDPAISKEVLRGVYRYSGGIPRRINLIMDRLLIHGALEHKHHFDAGDMHSVIQEMVGEFLLDPEPLIANVDLAATSNAGGEECSHSLPRDNKSKVDSSVGFPTNPEPDEQNQNSAAQDSALTQEQPLPSASVANEEAGENDRTAPAEPESEPEFEPEPELEPESEPLQVQKRPFGGKVVAVAVFLLAGASVVYQLNAPDRVKSQPDKLAYHVAEPAPRILPSTEQRVANKVELAGADVPAEVDSADTATKITPDRDKVVPERKEAPPVEVKVSEPAIQTAPDAPRIEDRQLSVKPVREKVRAQEKIQPTIKKPQKPPVIAALVESTPVKSAPVKIEPRFTPGTMISTLLDGHWNSGDKPAALLPSETTACNSQSDRINCVSVPQNIKTRYGLAQYKVATKLNGFSSQGHFEVSYQTQVKLMDPGTTEGGEWQLRDYSMSCTLSGNNRVSCVDGKGVGRQYRKAVSAKTHK